MGRAENSEGRDQTGLLPTVTATSHGTSSLVKAETARNRIVHRFALNRPFRTSSAVVSEGVKLQSPGPSSERCTKDLRANVRSCG